jgi:hypothetical protein
MRLLKGQLFTIRVPPRMSDVALSVSLALMSRRENRLRWKGESE